MTEQRSRVSLKSSWGIVKVEKNHLIQPKLLLATNYLNCHLLSAILLGCHSGGETEGLLHWLAEKPATICFPCFLIKWFNFKNWFLSLHVFFFPQDPLFHLGSVY